MTRTESKRRGTHTHTTRIKRTMMMMAAAVLARVGVEEAEEGEKTRKFVEPLQRQWRRDEWLGEFACWKCLTPNRMELKNDIKHWALSCHRVAFSHLLPRSLFRSFTRANATRDTHSHISSSFQRASERQSARKGPGNRTFWAMLRKRNNVYDSKMIKGLTHGWT